MRTMVSRFLLSLAAAALLATAVYAQVQAPQVPSTPSTPTVNLTMEHKHVLKENLLKAGKVKPEAMQVDLETGKKVPASVQLHAFPDEISSKIPQIKAHEYFIADDAVVIVQAQQRTIVEVVK
jgi:hypothetical protein